MSCSIQTVIHIKNGYMRKKINKQEPKLKPYQILLKADSTNVKKHHEN